MREAELSMLQRLGASEHAPGAILDAQCNLAMTYAALGRHNEALSLRQDVYSGRSKLEGEEHAETLQAALNYAASLGDLKRFGEVKALLRKIMPVARRVLGENHVDTLKMRWSYATALYAADDATLDDLREAVTALEDVERTARRLFGGAHPHTVQLERCLRDARTLLRAREA